jgi:hypothetical protein
MAEAAIVARLYLIAFGSKTTISTAALISNNATKRFDCVANANDAVSNAIVTANRGRI